MLRVYTGSPLNLTVQDVGSNANTSYTELGSYKSGDQIDSLFTTQNKYYRFETAGKQRSVLSKDENIHTNDVYDTSTFNILQEFQGISHLQLKPGDFVYNRDFGVYPNNRLIILRRFANPVQDDIYAVSSDKGPGTPISTIVGYVKETDDFLNFDVSEEWIKADASFKEILNKVGDDFAFGQFKIGDILARGNNIIPMPGATELLQRKLMVDFGLIDPEESAVIPSGDPNLIKDAKVRDLVKDGEAGSGLNGKITVNFEVTYEQKFIGGVDPTFVYMDIIGTLLAMGTSTSKFYLGGNDNTKLDKKIKEFIHNPNKTIKEFIEATISAFGGAIKKLKTLFNNATEKVSEDDGKSLTEKTGDWLSSTWEATVDLVSGDDEKAAVAEKGIDTIQNVLNHVTDYITDFISSKYRIQALGVFAALSGAPSTPWHVTIGNPLRPVFCSGDMLCTKIGIKEGPQLSFNDLPTYITATIELTSARDLGLQEIFTKLNSGGMRVTNPSTGGDRKGWLIEPGSTFWSKTSGLTASPTGISTTVDTSSTNTQNTIDQTKVTNATNTTDKIQPDPSIIDQIVDGAENVGTTLSGKAVELYDYVGESLSGATESLKNFFK
jgi:hypothetical protein